MKRALAERAKQSETGHPAAHTPNGLGPAHGPVAVSSGQPPRKVPRIDGETSHRQGGEQRIKTEPITIHVPSQSQATSSSAATTPRPSPSGTPPEKRSSLKRQRSNAALAEHDDEEPDSSGFYLKHQNRALASELKGLQYQLRLLEKERDLRRQQCQQAGQALQDLHNTWTQMEVALQLGTPPERPAVSSKCTTILTIQHARYLCFTHSYHFASLRKRNSPLLLLLQISRSTTALEIQGPGTV